MAKTSGTGRTYEPALADLRERIRTGTLAPGDWLPSETQLMREFGISRYFARQALLRLAGEGVITIVDGKGSQVVRARTDRARHNDTRTLTTEDGDSDGASDGEGARRWHDAEFAAWTSVEEPSTYRVDAGVDLALALGIPEYSPVFGVDRLLERPATPAGGATRRMLHRLYIPMAAAARIPPLADDPFRTPDELYTALADAGVAVTITEHVRAATPNPDDTASLNLTPSAPVLVTRRILRDTDDRPIAMEETRRSCEDTQLTYTIASSDR